MKAIDLLNKIAKGEEVPEKIKYNGKIYQYGYHYQWYLTNNLREELFIDKNHLNDEIEIIEDTPEEDKKIEKLDNNIAYCDGTYETRWSDSEMYIVDKLNEIIDKVNGE